MTIRLRNDISELERLADAVSRFCRGAGLPDELGLDLQLALEPGSEFERESKRAELGRPC